MRVVILDDEKKVLDLICALIDWDALGLHLCGTAGDGENALRLIEKERPDLIITDTKMPGLSGLEIVEKAHEMLPDAKAIVVSGYSRFDYAQSAIRQGVINYLLKPINKDELNGTLQRIIDGFNKQKAGELHIKDIEEHSRRLTQERNKESLLAMASEKTEGQSFAPLDLPLPISIVVTKIDSILFPCDIKTEAALEEHLIRRFDEAGEGRTVSAASSYYGPCIITAFGGTGDSQKASESILSECKKQQEIFRDFTFTVVYSPAVEKAGDAALAVQKALQGTELRLLRGTLQVIASPLADESEVADALHPLSSTAAKIDSTPVMSMFASMVNNDSDSYKKQRDSYISSFDAATARQVATQPPSPLAGIKEAVDVITEEVHVRITENTEAVKSLDACALAVNMSRTSKELIERMVLFLDCVYEAISRDSQEKCVRPVREAQRYIIEHYGDNMLCLNTIADSVSLSPNYLSALFKKNTGIGIAEYLQNIRMEKAKKQLTQTNDSIKQIAYSVGFNDPKHFSKTFKSAVGMKPNEYRKLYE